MPGMVLINETQFRPFMGNSAIWVRSTRKAFSMVLLVTRRFASASTDTASVTVPICELDLSDVDLGVDIQGDCHFSLLEACLLDSDDILARLNIDGLETARLIRVDFPCGAALCRVHDLDRGVRNEAAGRVDNGAADVL